MYPERLNFGAFLAPFHPLGEDPTLQFERDLELIELLDRLNYHEFWVGEHHSAGWNSIGIPELFLAAAADRTRQIKLASGVITLPYHHPFMVASRAIHLHHLTRGRFILGVGAGSIPVDAHMLGIEWSEMRQRFEESLEAVVELLTSEERVNAKTSWFTLQDAKLQFAPYRSEKVEIAAASVGSGNSMRLAGRHGISVVSFGVSRPGHKPPNLKEQWQIHEDAAAEHGQAIDRANWRITLPIFVGETRKEAIDAVRAGYQRWAYEYWGDLRGLDVSIPGVAPENAIEAAVEAGSAIVGSVEDCVAGIEQLREETGGFGTLLVYAQDWADLERTKRSYDLLARYVAPHFTGSAHRPAESAQWYKDNREQFPQLTLPGHGARPGVA
ncbi:LLM class flavin-dependent oxidoreductase [Nocardia sp. NPDC052566]|uniref:LLM class flavin-dependent oxidoreductase n=1 Tax=Nocardia sp. NPDC052566 TaxID=3364330 RepID=UPI0037C8206B